MCGLRCLNEGRCLSPAAKYLYWLILHERIFSILFVCTSAADNRALIRAKKTKGKDEGTRVREK